MAAIDKQALKDAFQKRSLHVLENKETMTMNHCRSILEEDLGLPPKSLKCEKEYVKQLIDELFSSHATAENTTAPSQEGDDEEAAPAADIKLPQKKKARRITSEADGPPRKKLKQKEEKKKLKQKEKDSRSAAPAAPTVKEYGREVQKLKRICKCASITVPPSVYTRVINEQDVVDRLRALLQKHGLSEQATSEDIVQVHRNLQKQRDLDGIDKSNILTEGRGRRAAAAAPRAYNYVDSGSLSDSDADDEGKDGENAQPANVSPGNRKQQEKKANGISEDNGASHSDGEACDSDACGMSLQSAGGTETDDAKKPGVVDEASSEPRAKKAVKRHLAQWSDDDD